MPLGLKKVFAQNISHWKLRMKQLRRSHKFPWSSHNFIDYSHECFDTLSRICFLQKYLIHKITNWAKFGGDRNVGTIAQADVTVGKSPSAKDNAASLRSAPGSYIWIDCWLFVRLNLFAGIFYIEGFETQIDSCWLFVRFKFISLAFFLMSKVLKQR